MKKFLWGMVVGAALVSGLGLFGACDLNITIPGLSGLFSDKETGPDIVAPEDLVEGAQKFGTLKVVLTTGGRAFVSDIEVDVAEYPGAKMAVEVTDRDGTALFVKVPVGNYAVFFNDATYPKNFEKISTLIPVRITEGETTVRAIDLKPLP